MSDACASAEAKLALKVMKFGGSSVGSTERQRQLVSIVRRAAEEERLLVVVSALSGVTRQLDAAFATAARKQPTAEALDALGARHRTQAAQFLSPGALECYEAFLRKRLAALDALLAEVRAGGGTPARRDAALSAGEQLAVPMAAGALNATGLDARPADATRLIRTDAAHGAARVDRQKTAAQIRAWHAEVPQGAVPVVAGFIGATEAGVVTTLGFEGSDYSAALFAAALQARVLERWTDVDGIYTADPRTHPEAERIDVMNLKTAAALNEAGRLGMHPKALRPLLAAGIPAHIRCIDRPDQPGTRIVPDEDDG